MYATPLVRFAIPIMVPSISNLTVPVGLNPPLKVAEKLASPPTDMLLGDATSDTVGVVARPGQFALYVPVVTRMGTELPPK
jgi:hypothetical protein